MSGQAQASTSTFGKISRPGRLPSLFPKDLTLGANNSGAAGLVVAAAARRQFTPNLALAGKRLGAQEPKSDTQSRYRNKEKKPYGRNDSRRGAFAGRGRDQQHKLIQSKGVFSEGPLLETAKEKSDSVGSLRVDRGGHSSAQTKFSKNAKDGREDKRKYSSVKVDDDAEDDEEAIRILKADAFIDDNDEPEMNPIFLPLTKFVQGKPVQTKKLRRIKQEPMEIDNASTSSADLRDVMDTKDVKDIANTEKLKFEQSTANLIEAASSENRSDSPSLILLQLPSVLADLYGALNKEKDSKPVVKSELRGELDCAGTSSCFSSCAEGKIGKLQIFSSGRAKIVIGGQNFFVDVGLPSSFLQEVVAVDVKGAEGDMCTLGRIKHKLVLSSDVDELVVENSNGLKEFLLT